VRDLDFKPTPFSTAVSESEKHLPGNSVLIRETQDEVANILAEPEAPYPVELETADALDFSSIYERLMQEYKGEVKSNPEFRKDLEALWGFQTNEHGVIREPLEEVLLIDRKDLTITIYLAESAKGYCKYGMNLRTEDSGRCSLPSIYSPVGFCSKDIALREAQAEVLNWLEREQKTARGKKHYSLKSAIKKISALGFEQLDVI